jgi:hypothetical protein
MFRRTEHQLQGVHKSFYICLPADVKTSVYSLKMTLRTSKHVEVKLKSNKGCIVHLIGFSITISITTMHGVSSVKTKLRCLGKCKYFK